MNDSNSSAVYKNTLVNSSPGILKPPLSESNHSTAINNSANGIQPFQTFGGQNYALLNGHHAAGENDVTAVGKTEPNSKIDNSSENLLHNNEARSISGMNFPPGTSDGNLRNANNPLNKVPANSSNGPPSSNFPAQNLVNQSISVNSSVNNVMKTSISNDQFSKPPTSNFLQTNSHNQNGPHNANSNLGTRSNNLVSNYFSNTPSNSELIGTISSTKMVTSPLTSNSGTLSPAPSNFLKSTSNDSNANLQSSMKQISDTLPSRTLNNSAISAVNSPGPPQTSSQSSAMLFSTQGPPLMANSIPGPVTLRPQGNFNMQQPLTSVKPVASQPLSVNSNFTIRPSSSQAPSPLGQPLPSSQGFAARSLGPSTISHNSSIGLPSSSSSPLLNHSPVPVSFQSSLNSSSSMAYPPTSFGPSHSNVVPSSNSVGPPSFRPPMGPSFRPSMAPSFGTSVGPPSVIRPPPASISNSLSSAVSPSFRPPFSPIGPGPSICRPPSSIGPPPTSIGPQTGVPSPLGPPQMSMGPPTFMGPPKSAGLYTQVNNAPPLQPPPTSMRVSPAPSLGPPPLAPSGPSLGPPPLTPSGPSLGPPPLAPSGPSLGPPPLTPSAQSLGPPPLTPSAQSLGPPPLAPSGPSPGPPPLSCGSNTMNSFSQRNDSAPRPHNSVSNITGINSTSTNTFPGMQASSNTNSKYPIPPSLSASGPPSNVSTPNQNYHGQSYSQPSVIQLSKQLGGFSITKDGWNQGWGGATGDLLQQRCIVPPQGIIPPKVKIMQDFVSNCSPDIFRSSLTKIPETKSALQKSRMPFGLLIHPFKDLDQLAVVSCNTIVRCRSCRTYINPFVVFKGERRWECNLCFRVNEIPDEFLFDPVSRTYGDPSRRPECKEATIEFIAPQEYMLRPPQPAVYIYVLDVSRQAVDSGYLQVVCETMLSLIDKIPGDRRTMIGFITFSTTLQFYLLGEDQKSVHMLEVGELDDVFIPSPQDLLVNVEECRDLIEELLVSLPDTHANTVHSQSAFGAALTAAYKMIGGIGGRISVMVSTLPNVGPGALKSREDPNLRSAKDISNLSPATDFYKKLALDCSGQQVAVDLFVLNSQFIDMATLTGISKFSGGSIYHFPGFHTQKNPAVVDQFRSCFIRYLTRKIGFESVMRVRATRGLAITNFHGNFFVRSTDLLALPNVGPDAGFGMQVVIEEPLHNIRQACFQAALLYTSSKGERRIRVHTLCLPVTSNVHEIVGAGDQQAIIGLLSKMAVDKCLSSNMSDAREAIVNACVDIMSSYRVASGGGGGIPAPPTLNMVPLYCLALLKSVALRHGISTKLDDRVFAMCELKTMPLDCLMLTMYPDLYPVHEVSEKDAIEIDDLIIPQPGRIHLSAEYISRNGAYLMDAGSVIYIYIRSGVSPQWVNDVIGVPSFEAIPQPLYDDPLPTLDNCTSELMRNFVFHLQKNKAYPVPLFIIREDNPSRTLFLNLLVDDRSEVAHSYVEFLQFIKSQMK